MQQYSQQISSSMPQPYQGIGATGMGWGFTPGAFNYGNQNSMTSYAPGNTAGNVGLSMATGGAQLGMAGLGIAGGMGMMGSFGKVFDPFSMGAAAFRGAGAMGMGMGGRLAAGALGFGAVAAPMAMAGHAIGQMAEGGHEQAGIEQVLSRFQFANSNSRTSRGFTRQDSMQIGNMVRELAHIPDMLTSVGELTKIMDRIGQMGLMNGVRDANQFQEKFKQTLGTIKDVARIMGTTLEGAAETFGEARRSGFYSQNDVVKNAINRQVTSGLTGMSQGQVGQLQQMGAQMGFATGGSRAAGAKNITRTAQTLGLMNRTGMLSDDQIAELTGEEGGAGIQSMAASLTEAGYKMSQSSLGSAMTAALGQVKDGRFTGQMDADLVERVRRGDIGKGELMKLARQKTAGRTGKLSFSAHRGRLTSEMVGAVGAEGIGMELGNILGERGFDNPDAQNLVMQRYGVDERQAEQIMAMGRMGSTGELQSRQGQEAKRAGRSAYMAENFSWDAIKKKIETRIESVTSEPFKQMGVSIRNSIASRWDSFIDDVTGHYSAQMSQGVQALIQSSAAGKTGAAANLRALTAGGSVTGSFLGGSQGGSSLLRAMGGGSLGEDQAGLAKRLGFGSLIGNVSGAAGSAAMSGFANRLTSQGIEGLRKGGEAEYDSLSKKLQGILGSDAVAGKGSHLERFNEVMKLASSENDRMTMAAMGGEGAVGVDIPETDFEKYAKKKGMTPERLVAQMLQGDPTLSKMSTRPDIGKIFGGGSGETTNALAKRRKDMERDMAGDVGMAAVQGALNDKSLVETGVLMKALTMSDEEQQDAITSILSGDYDKVAKIGVTKENASAALKLLRQTKAAGGSGRGKLLEYVKTAANESTSLMKEHLEDRAIAARKLTESSNAVMKAVGGKYASDLQGGNAEEAGKDIGTMVQALGKMSKGERDKALSELRSSGNFEVIDAYNAYEKGGGLKGGAKASKALEAAIDRGTKSLTGGAGGREGSVFASEEAVKSYFDKLNANQSQIAQILGNISAGKPAGEGISAPERKTGT